VRTNLAQRQIWDCHTMQDLWLFEASHWLHGLLICRPVASLSIKRFHPQK